jgi:hypothetical protein
MLFGVVTLFALVLVPFLFWHGTWFGRPLSDREIEQYLNDDSHPRHEQHALVQISQKLDRGDASVQRWYPRVCALAHSREIELRITAAWLMGQDNRADAFHRSLLEALQDPEPLVRRNAALSLARFGDASGRPELRAMLEPFSLLSPADGILRYRLKVRDPAERGTVIAILENGGSRQSEVRSPLPGKILSKTAADGKRVQKGDEIAKLEPSADHVWEALRALYLVGAPEDLADIEKFTRPLPDWPSRIAEQAKLTAQQIRNRG